MSYRYDDDDEPVTTTKASRTQSVINAVKALHEKVLGAEKARYGMNDAEGIAYKDIDDYIVRANKPIIMLYKKARRSVLYSDRLMQRFVNALGAYWPEAFCDTASPRYGQILKQLHRDIKNLADEQLNRDWDSLEKDIAQKALQKAALEAYPLSREPPDRSKDTRVVRKLQFPNTFR